MEKERAAAIGKLLGQIDDQDNRKLIEDAFEAAEALHEKLRPLRLKIQSIHADSEELQGVESELLAEIVYAAFLFKNPPSDEGLSFDEFMDIIRHS